MAHPAARAARFHFNCLSLRAALLAGLCLVANASSVAVADSPIRFSRDVRPILSEHCFHCHGPDAASREADLRLDVAATYEAGADASGVVVPRQPEASELYQRIVAPDDELRMPPPEAPTQLSPEEIAVLRRWIAEGAAWEGHWAFLPIESGQLPEVAHANWARNEIDRFLLRRMEQSGLAPSPEADKTTLIRRATLDLTGLPPTPAEIDHFLADDRLDAYERLVDRLLDSPRYGEQMAAVWLDAARYADTYGYQDDGDAEMWRYRDWVIDAYNANMPFDQFTIEQLAGDLLPNATASQQIATAFNRNHRHNSEGGAIPEEFRVEYVADRANTTATVWLGLTVGCARCHDHKYDPITQREFYQWFAHFNNVDEDGRARKEGNTPPMIPAPTAEQLAEEHRLAAELAAAERRAAALEPPLARRQRIWEATVDADDLATAAPLIEELKLHIAAGERLAAAAEAAVPADPETYRRAVLGDASQGFVLDGQTELVFGDVGSFSSDNRVTLSAHVSPAASDGAILSKIEDPRDPQDEGYTVALRDGRVRVHLTSQWQDDAIRVETATRLPLEEWTHLAVVYDGSHKARGLRVYFNGVAQPVNVEFDLLFQGFGNDGPLRIGTDGDPDRRFVGNIDDVRLYETELSPRELQRLAARQSIAKILATSEAERSVHASVKLRDYYLKHAAAPSDRAAHEQVVRLQRQLDAHRRRYPTVMVMRERKDRRPTYVLERGLYDAPGEEVAPGVPAVFPGSAAVSPPNRLGLAQWLVSPDHPLTARVAVNRLWQMSFYRGLVRTAEDFGVQGERPTHPELLDWLARELIDSGWDVKTMRRRIVTSAAYRQSSAVDEALLAADPQNRLLARGPRFRLPAETIRDAALGASGLLVEQLGGPSVKPYQPPGLWEEVSGDVYEQDAGKDLYRRSLYTFWKRTVLHPLMGTLDAPSREICTVREERTNTPLQALTLLNEQAMVEAARMLAERVLREAGPSTREQLAYAFRLVTARKPEPQELDVLQQLFEQHRRDFVDRPDDATLLLSVGRSPSDPAHAPPVAAAMTTVANLLLNLDEAVTQH